MKSVSPEYVESMEQPLRNLSHINISFGNVDTTAPDDGSWAVTGNEYAWSDTEIIDVNHRYSGPSYATLELNRWVGDGTFYVAPDDPAEYVPQGFCSDAMSDVNGSFSTNPALTRVFSRTHAIPGLMFYFDTVQGEHPASVRLRLWRNGTRVFNQTYSGLTENVLEVLLTDVGEIDTIELAWLKQEAYHRARLEKVVYGRYIEFTDENIVSAEYAQDVDPLSRRLPKDSFTFTVIDYDASYDPDNPEGIYSNIDVHSPISVSFGYELDDGTTEWLTPNRYVLNGKPIVRDYKATFNAVGLLDTMDGIFSKGVWETKTLYELAEEVLTDADLDLTAEGDTPWVIDASLANMSTDNPMPLDTHKNCLQLIAHAAGCYLYTDSENVIHIEPFDQSDLLDTPLMDITFHSILENSLVVNKTPTLRNLIVEKYWYTPAESRTILSQFTTTDTEVHVEFPMASDIQITVSGGTLTSSSVYAQSADLVLSAGTKVVTIKGYVLTQSSDTKVFTGDVLGDDDTEKNVLISNDTMRDALGAQFVNYLGLRSTYDLEYRGNPEIECRDLLSVETNYTPSMNALVLCLSLRYDGALHGTLKVKGVL